MCPHTLIFALFLRGLGKNSSFSVKGKEKSVIFCGGYSVSVLLSHFLRG